MLGLASTLLLYDGTRLAPNRYGNDTGTMKNAHSRILFTIGLAVLAATPWVRGAALPEGQEAQHKTAVGLAELQAAVDRGQEQLAATMAALKDLIEKPQQDLRPQYEVFNQAVTQLRADAQVVQDHAAWMAKHRDDYLALWDKTASSITTGDVAKLMERRRKALDADLKRVTRRLTSAAKEYEPLLQKLDDIQQYFSVDLSRPAVKSAVNLEWRASNEARSARGALNRLTKELNRVAERLSPGEEA